jgi:hypothetical protein
MLRSHHRLVCTVASLICGIAPIAVNAQESLTDHDTERLTPALPTSKFSAVRQRLDFLASTIAA